MCLALDLELELRPLELAIGQRLRAPRVAELVLRADERHHEPRDEPHQAGEDASEDRGERDHALLALPRLIE